MTMTFATMLCFGMLISAQDGAPPFSGRALELFEEGKAQFEEASWVEAEDLFKNCKKATDKEGAKYLKVWLKACQGGKKLDKLVASKNPRKAWAQIGKLKKTYGKTPLQPEIEAAAEKIHRKIYYLLSTFEKNPPDPESQTAGLPDGAEYTNDKTYVKGGARAVKWSARPDYTRAPSLPLGKIDGSILKDYRYLSLWIYSPDKTLGKYILIFNIGNVDVLDGDGNPAEDCFFRYVNVTKPGWMHVRVELSKTLSKFGNASQEDVRGLHLLMLPFSRPKTIFVDEVMLERG